MLDYVIGYNEVQPFIYINKFKKWSIAVLLLLTLVLVVYTWGYANYKWVRGDYCVNYNKANILWILVGLVAMSHTWVYLFRSRWRPDLKYIDFKPTLKNDNSKLIIE